LAGLRDHAAAIRRSSWFVAGNDDARLERGHLVQYASVLSWAFQQNNPALSRTRDMLNGSLKIAKLILMCDLEKLRVVLGEIQSEFEVSLLFILAQTKPAHDQNALERDIVGCERIDIRSNVAVEGAKVDDGPTLIENLRQIVNRFSAQGIKSHFELVSFKGVANLFFPIVVTR